jgi:hypothetical protein
MAHTCSLSYSGSGARRIMVQGQVGQKLAQHMLLIAATQDAGVGGLEDCDRRPVGQKHRTQSEK